MKKLISIMITIGLLTALLPAHGYSAGGAGPFFASCCIGPRIGLEMNEGKEIRAMEWFRLVPYIGWFGTFFEAVEAYDGKTMSGKTEGKGGCSPFFGSCCLGPRVGLEMNEGRGIRTVEWFYLIPVVNIVAALIVSFEAGGGKTMTDIEANENLRK